MRRLLSALAGAAVVAGLAAPATALAAGYNDIGFSVNPNGAWTFEPNNAVRNKTTSGNMSMNVNDLTDGGVCVRLVNANTGTAFTAPTCWSKYATKTIATNVLAGTRFRVQAQKKGFGTNNAWGAYRPSGWFYY